MTKVLLVQQVLIQLFLAQQVLKALKVIKVLLVQQVLIQLSLGQLDLLAHKAQQDLLELIQLFLVQPVLQVQQERQVQQVHKVMLELTALFQAQLVLREPMVLMAQLAQQVLRVQMDLMV